MKVLIPENSFLWTPKGLAFPNNLNEGSEIFIIDSNNNLIPIFIQDEIESYETQVTTVLTNVSVLTIPQEYSINVDGKKIPISDLKSGMYIDFISNQILDNFKKYFMDNLEQFSEKFFNIIKARLMGKTYLHTSNYTPYLIPDDAFDQEQARKIGLSLEEEFGKGNVTMKFSGNFSGYWKATKNPWKIFVNEKNFTRIRNGICSNDDTISSEIYSSGLNPFIHFHKIALAIGVPAYFNYEVRNQIEPYVILNLNWDSKFRKLFQNSCLFERKKQLRVYESRQNRSTDEVKIEDADKNGIISSQKILDIRFHKKYCYQIDIPLGSKLVVDNYYVSPIEINFDNREIIEIQEDDFEKIRNDAYSMATDETQPIPVQIKKTISLQYSSFSIVGRIISYKTPREVNTKFGKKVLFEGVIEDETSELKFSVWCDSDFSIFSDYSGMFLFIKYGKLKNGIATNEFGKKIELLEVEKNKIQSSMEC